MSGVGAAMVLKEMEPINSNGKSREYVREVITLLVSFKLYWYRLVELYSMKTTVLSIFF